MTDLLFGIVCTRHQRFVEHKIRCVTSPVKWTSVDCEHFLFMLRDFGRATRACEHPRNSPPLPLNRVFHGAGNFSAHSRVPAQLCLSRKRVLLVA